MKTACNSYTLIITVRKFDGTKHFKLRFFLLKVNLVNLRRLLETNERFLYMLPSQLDYIFNDIPLISVIHATQWSLLLLTVSRNKKIPNSFNIHFWIIILSFF